MSVSNITVTTLVVVSAETGKERGNCIVAESPCFSYTFKNRAGLKKIIPQKVKFYCF